MLEPTCDDILPTSRRVYVMLIVLLLKVAREAWTKSSTVVSFKGRRTGQPKQMSSVDSICNQREKTIGFCFYFFTLVGHIL